MTSDAKRWVEDKFPSVQGTQKAMLILAYGAGMDAGMAEAQGLIYQAMAQVIARQDAPNRDS